MNSISHRLTWLGLMAIGTLLRFYHLAAKPLWQDEVITALLSLGQGYTAVPLDQVVTLSALAQVLTLKPTSCAAIAQMVRLQSVHPPLFFCGLHEWLAAMSDWPLAIAWQLRALPALAGVGAIAAVYALNRMAFSPRAGLMAAALMAMSPFAVYLSQEARHYTIPMGLVTIALICLVKILQDFQLGQLDCKAWLLWVGVNGLGFYVHYFFILAVIAQVLTLASLWRGRAAINQCRGQFLRPISRSVWLPIAAVSAIGLIILPWWPIFVSHLSRPETDWLKPFEPSWIDTIAPLWQFPVGWLLMVVALPVEQQPLVLAIPAVALTLLFAIWLVLQMVQRLRYLWPITVIRLPVLILGSFIGWVLIEFLAIVYLLHKDITQVPRYNFIYYPAVCALLGVMFSVKPKNLIPISTEDTAKAQKSMHWFPRSSAFLLLVGLMSCLFVVTDQVLHKPYFPEQVAQDITADHSGAGLVVMSYENLQDIALGLSFALALQHVATKPEITFALMTRSPNYTHLWKNLQTLKGATPQNLWMIAPGLRQRDFPTQLGLAHTKCELVPKRFRRIGIPYQGYRCHT